MKKLLSSILFCLIVGSANAALIESDLLATGDGLLFIDTNTNREWVDVAKTTNMSVNQFFNNSIYANQGFILADQDSLFELYSNAGATDIHLDDTITWTSGNIAAATELANIMEHESPFTQTNGNSWIHGYMDIGNTSNVMLSRFNAYGIEGASFGINTNGLWSYDTTHTAIGIWAYRDVSVPESGALGLLALSLIGLGLIRRRS